jgi:uncharacterized protein YbbK (DUF523 family)
MKSLLISKCLFGENVRYDGGNCLLRGDYIARLKNKFNLVFICPEVMAGMSVPREPIENINGTIVDKAGNDYTESFDPVKKEIFNLVKKNNITLALLKEFSPSCGSSKIYDGHFSGEVIDGEGIIAKQLRAYGVEVYSELQIEILLKKS